MIIVSLPGLLRLISKSKKPEALRFMDWVFHDVLPAILRTGRYVVNETDVDAVGLTDSTLAASCMPAPLGAQVAFLNWVTKGRGFEVAAAYLPQLGLPPLPPAPQRIGASGQVLPRILDHEIDGRAVQDLIDDAVEGDADAVELLERFGIRVGEGGIWVANVPGGVKDLFAPNWQHALHKLPGARTMQRQMFIGHRFRATWLPASLLG